MSKGLEEIKTLRGFNEVELNNDKNVNNSLDIIEDELKVLEIIINKYVDIHYLEISKSVEEYNEYAEKETLFGMELTEDEFKLVKEVQKNV